MTRILFHMALCISGLFCLMGFLTAVLIQCDVIDVR